MGTWIVAGLLLLVLWRISSLRGEMHRWVHGLAAGVDARSDAIEERLADLHITAEQARDAANEARDNLRPPRPYWLDISD